MGRTTVKRVIFTGVALAALTACNGLPDFDLRDLGDGFDTSAAVANLPDRPRPDDRGVISYPNYQVVIAQRGDTINAIAGRLNVNANELARFNGIKEDTVLRRDELIALPNRVAEPSPATGAETTGPIATLDITEIATTALDRAGPQAPVATTTLEPATPAATPTPSAEPIRHKVKRGETVFEISRLYNVPVANIAEWNGLDADLLVQEGRFLLIPQGGARPPEPVETPEPTVETPIVVETPAPDVIPEVAVTPEVPAPAPAPTPTASTSAARLQLPVNGTIIREYAKGRNEGIDIGVPAGTNVQAADGGIVAAVTTDTSGVAIVVLKHADNLLTVYTNIENLTVSKNDRVAKGDNLGKVRAGSPSFLHFEVRRGLNSINPTEMLPG